MRWGAIRRRCFFSAPLLFLLLAVRGWADQAYSAFCADFLGTKHTKLLAVDGDFAAKPAPTPAVAAYTRDGEACRREVIRGEMKLRTLAGGRTVSLMIAPVGTSRWLAVDFEAARVLRTRPGDVLELTPLRRAQDARKLEGHTGPVLAAAFSPDGKQALTGGQDGVARLWDLREGRTVRTLGGHRGGVYAVAFSADGKRAMTGAFDETAREWDLESGRTIHTLAGHGHLVSCVAFAPDGRRAVTGSWDQRLILWDLERGVPLDEINLESSCDYPSTLAFAPDGRRFLVGTLRGVILEFAWK